MRKIFPSRPAKLYFWHERWRTICLRQLTFLFYSAFYKRSLYLLIARWTNLADFYNFWYIQQPNETWHQNVLNFSTSHVNRSLDKLGNTEMLSFSNLRCRSVVKSGVRVSQVKPSNCFRLHSTSMTSRQSRFLTACRRLEKLVLLSIFDIGPKSFILDDVKLAELSESSFEWKNVTF